MIPFPILYVSSLMLLLESLWPLVQADKPPHRGVPLPAEAHPDLARPHHQALARGRAVHSLEAALTSVPRPRDPLLASPSLVTLHQPH